MNVRRSIGKKSLIHYFYRNSLELLLSWYIYSALVTQSTRLVDELKAQLKMRRVTYRTLAKELALSESAIKQMFASGNMTLNRLDAICEILGIDITALVQMADDSSRQLQSLEINQEAELVGDTRLLLVAYCIVNNWTFSEILERYDLTEPEGIRYLARLDKMKLIELLPGNRVKPLISSNFNWQPDGPIENYFKKEVQGPFFNSNFNDEACMRLVKLGDISVVARQQILERMHAIGQMFDDIVKEEKSLQLEQRQGTTMVLAIRNWMFQAFVALERK